MIHLFRVWDRCAARIRQAEHIVLLFDFDGTLSPIANRPEIPRLSPFYRQMLPELIRRDRQVAVGIISGRGLRDLRRRIGIRGLYYAGNHGLELRGPHLRFLHPGAAATRPVLVRIAKQLRKRLGGIPGILVEDKTLSLSFHFRQVPRARHSTVQDLFMQTVTPYLRRGEVRVTRGKMVLEVRPAVKWDKGSAVKLIRRAIEREWSPRKSLLSYLGDDETDEAAFASLRANDLAVFVGGRKPGSAASYYLRDPAEVEEFLRRFKRLRTVMAA
ncbi:MAG: trehalose-phosphatase [Candidatus Methylomirabilales bacterium]